MSDTKPTSPTLEMERAIACLALELPGEVWTDVRDIWHAARDATAARIAEQDGVIESHHADFVKINEIASKARTVKQGPNALHALLDALALIEGLSSGPDQVAP